jgi:hypothetical protein
MNLVAFTSDSVSVFHLIDEMKQRGWYIQPQLGFRGSKENIHLSINPASAKWVDEFIADLRECAEKARAIPSGELTDVVRQFVSELKPGELDDQSLAGMLSLVGAEGAALPARMASINEMLNSLPAELREQVLTAYVNQLFRYRGSDSRSTPEC